MNIFEYVRIAVQSIGASKARSFLTILGIIIGIASVVMMIGLGNGTRKTIENSFVNLGTNTLVIYSQPPMSGIITGSLLEFSPLTQKDIKAIEDSKLLVDGIESISPELFTSQQIVRGRYNEYASVIGVTNEYQIINSLELKAGIFITEKHVVSNSKVVVIGSNIAERFFKNSNPIGKNIRVKNQTLKVIGVLEKVGGIGYYPYDDAILIPISTLQNLIEGNKNYSNIIVKVRAREQVDTIKSGIENVLAYSRKEINPSKRTFIVQSSNQMLNEVNNITAGFTIFMSLIAGISLVVGAIGITNTMIATISERTKEIGLRKAVGARNSYIRLQFLIESIVLTLLGGIFGVLFAIVLAQLFNQILAGSIDLGFSSGVIIIDFNATLLAALISCLVGMISGLYPAIKASKLNPIDALRYE